MGVSSLYTNTMAATDEKSPVAKIEAFLEKIEIMQTLQDKSGVKKLYIAAGISLFVVIFILFGFGAGLLCNFVGFVYPAFASFKSLESSNANDDRLWLTYWVVYSCFCLIEGFLEYLLFWVPFYFPIKLGFLFYLFLPQTQGARIIYESFLRPALKPYVSIIDEAVSEGINKGVDIATKVAGATTAVMGKEPVKEPV